MSEPIIKIERLKKEKEERRGGEGKVAKVAKGEGKRGEERRIIYAKKRAWGEVVGNGGKWRSEVNYERGRGEGKDLCILLPKEEERSIARKGGRGCL